MHRPLPRPVAFYWPSKGQADPQPCHQNQEWSHRIFVCSKSIKKPVYHSGSVILPENHAASRNGLNFCRVTQWKRADKFEYSTTKRILSLEMDSVFVLM